MDVPISLALILASSISLYETVQGGHHAYFDAAVSLCFFLLAGRYLDYRTRAAARSAAEELAALEVPRAARIGADGAETVVPIGDLAAGDRVRVRPGARMPVDGVVEAGESEIDRSLLTGETLPVAVAARCRGQRRRGQPDRTADAARHRGRSRLVAAPDGRSGRGRRKLPGTATPRWPTAWRGPMRRSSTSLR